MKRQSIILSLFLFAVPLLYAQDREADAYAGRPVVRYRNNDSIARQLDYSNTVCDTLFYHDQVILLEESPLLQSAEVRDLVERYRQAVPVDSLYNCQREYTATWEIKDSLLYLVGLSAFENREPLLKEMLKLKFLRRVGKKPVFAGWVSDTLRGGADAVKTNYGYAFKQEYQIPVESGVKKGEIRNEFPVGTLENAERLTAFMREYNRALFDGFLDIEFIKNLRASRQARNDTFSFLLPLTTDAQGETYYQPPTWRTSDIFDLSSDKSLEGRPTISKMNFANTLPKGGFYPRFLRTGTIYQPTYVRFLYTIYKEISDVELIYYTPEVNARFRNSEIWFAE